MSPVFADLRSVTSAWECTRRGIDVMPTNPCDPWLRPANYPRLWLAPTSLGLGQESTFAIGIGMAAAFFAAALTIVPRRARPVEIAVYAIAVCSPAVMLGVERGNVDLLLFAIVVAAALLLRRSTTGAVVGPALLLLAAMLKLFPIFASVVLFRERRRAAVLGGIAVLLAFGAYAILVFDDIVMIAEVVPQVDFRSYGIRQVSEWVRAGIAGVSPGLAELTGGTLWRYVSDLLLAMLVLGVALLVQFRGASTLHTEIDDRRSRLDLDLFVAGVGVYVGTYILFRNFDYRLAFLLLTLPQLLRWVHQGSTIAVVTLLALIGALWLGAPWDELPVIGWVFVAWDRLTSVAPIDQPLRPVTVAEFVLFAGLLTLSIPLFQMSAGRRWSKRDEERHVQDEKIV